MSKKLLLIMSCFIFLLSCSAQEDFNNFTSKPVSVDNPDSIAKPGNVNNDSIVNYPIVDVPVIPVKRRIVAHRGAWKNKKLPQNSIASLREAISLGCKGSEFDILLTADDSIVVCHDANYNNLFIQNAKYSDLITLKLSNGEKLPTLREYILAGKQNNTNTQLFCELKNNGLDGRAKKVFVTKTLELVNKLNAEQLMVYISFDYDLLGRIHTLNSTAKLQYLNGDLPPDQLKIDNVASLDYNNSVYEIHPEWIDNAKKNNLELSVWTVNEANRIIFYLNNNFDAITTDEPELALSFQNKLK